MLHNTAQNILDMYTFWKMSCFLPRQFNRGNVDEVGYSKFFYQATVSNICRFLVAASRFVVGALHLIFPPGYGPGLFCVRPGK